MKSIIIQEFMLKELHLKGYELLFYAVVFSFSTFGQSCFVSEKTFCNFLDISRSQFYKVRSSLLLKKLIRFDESGKGLIIYNSQFLSYKNEDLDELVRIARTPWLD